MRSLSILLVVGLAALVGCRGATTRAAIKSEAPEPVTVTVVSPNGQSQVVFTEVAPGTTTPFEKLPFESFRSVKVQVDGVDKSATLDLTEQGDNLLTVTSDKQPTLGEVRENPENAPFW